MVANGDIAVVVLVDRVSILPGVMCTRWCVLPELKKATCVARAVDDGVCRHQAFVADVEEAWRVSLRKKMVCGVDAREATLFERASGSH